MNQKVLNRFKSFAWRLGMMVAVILADYVTQNLTGFGFPAYVTIALGLIAGEVSKFLNTELGTLEVVTASKPVAKKKKK
jgi:hypothetical protein